MNFKQYLDKCNPDRVLDCVVDIFKRYKYDKFDEDSQRQGFHKVIEQLNSLTPNKNTEYTLHVMKCQDGLKSWGGQVTGKRKNDKENYAMEFRPWKELLAMPVESCYDEDHTVAYLLWEITFFGFEEEQIQEQLEELKKRAEKVKKQVKKKKNERN